MAASNRRVLPGFSLSLGYTIVYLSALVLVPIAACLLKASSLSATEFWAAIWTERARAAYLLTFGASLAAASINLAIGGVIAWVLVREPFPGRRFVDALIDLPLALPTAVAGLVFATLYVESGWIGRFLVPLGIQGAYTRLGIVLVLVFVGLPFVVRTVQPVLEDLPVEDEEISAFAHKAFTKQGMTVMTGAKVQGVKKNGKLARVTVEDSKGKVQDIEVEVVISAVGIVGNVENLGLDGTKVKVEKTHVVTDPYGATGEPGVYAIGDLAGPPWLAHKASHEGVVCVEKIAGLKGVHPLDTKNIPGCTYCRPQVASVGLTEAKAKEAGHEVKVGRFPFIGNGKAIALGEPEGMVKTVFDAKTGELLGAHMIGAEVTELIQGYTIARTLESTEAELMHTVFPHPTLSEMMHESVLDAYGRAIHF